MGFLTWIDRMNRIRELLFIRLLKACDPGMDGGIGGGSGFDGGKDAARLGHVLAADHDHVIEFDGGQTGIGDVRAVIIDPAPECFGSPGLRGRQGGLQGLRHAWQIGRGVVGRLALSGRKLFAHEMREMPVTGATGEERDANQDNAKELAHLSHAGK